VTIIGNGATIDASNLNCKSVILLLSPNAESSDFSGNSLIDRLTIVNYGGAHGAITSLFTSLNITRLAALSFPTTVTRHSNNKRRSIFKDFKTTAGSEVDYYGSAISSFKSDLRVEQ